MGSALIPSVHRAAQSAKGLPIEVALKSTTLVPLDLCTGFGFVANQERRNDHGVIGNLCTLTWTPFRRPVKTSHIVPQAAPAMIAPIFGLASETADS